MPRLTLPEAETPAHRYEFVGKVAEDPVHRKYVGRSLAGLFKNGEANSVRYFYNETV